MPFIDPLLFAIGNTRFKSMFRIQILDGHGILEINIITDLWLIIDLLNRVLRQDNEESEGCVIILTAHRVAAVKAPESLVMPEGD